MSGIEATLEEKYGQGFRILKQNGYKPGMGLGMSEQGIVIPIQIIGKSHFQTKEIQTHTHPILVQGEKKIGIDIDNHKNVSTIVNKRIRKMKECTTMQTSLILSRNMMNQPPRKYPRGVCFGKKENKAEK
jgi:hypothetical protein